MLNNHPQITVIITCYNQGRYLQNALDSISVQEREDVEVIVIDDGSSDNTKEVSESNDGVIYIFKENAGLPAARNTGISHSRGRYIVFLDADDWLLPAALNTNLRFLELNGDLAFVSGAHVKVNQNGETLEVSKSSVTTNHFNHLLSGNYIGMHATVMYQRWVFDGYNYDTSLKACEDYDLYLSVAKDHKVGHHDEILAAYRMHENNMSSNIFLMLDTTLLVLHRHARSLSEDAEIKSYKSGVSIWKSYYCDKAYNLLRLHISTSGSAFRSELDTLKKYDWLKYAKIMVRTFLIRHKIPGRNFNVKSS